MIRLWKRIRPRRSCWSSKTISRRERKTTQNTSGRRWSTISWATGISISTSSMMSEGWWCWSSNSRICRIGWIRWNRSWTIRGNRLPVVRTVCQRRWLRWTRWSRSRWDRPNWGSAVWNKPSIKCLKSSRKVKSGWVTQYAKNADSIIMMWSAATENSLRTSPSPSQTLLHRYWVLTQIRPPLMSKKRKCTL